MNPKFPLGGVYITPGVIHNVEATDVATGIARHVQGDWGDVGAEDSQVNDSALKHGNRRLLSAYRDSKGTKFWIITEWDRSSTTVLLPEEY